MLENEITIILPEKISILRDTQNQGICTDREEYSIYYQNIIYPYSEEYDIQIECEFGKNLGNCWRLDEFTDGMGIFDFTINIYLSFGVLAASRQCAIEVFEKKEHEEAALLCIGDSMTRDEIYISHSVNKSKKLKTVGLRNINRGVNHEGRGGWTCGAYFERHEDDGWGVSPFLFPVGFEGKIYYGSKRFYDMMSDTRTCTDYSHNGTSVSAAENGMLFYENNALFRYDNGALTEIEREPVFEFSFAKYIERYSIESPHIVSLLFGANEFQTCGYSGLKEELSVFVSNLRKMIQSIHEFDSSIKIIVNIPVCGGSQYAWGIRMGCAGSLKQYDYCIKMAGKALLEEFDGRRCENIFVCPMIAVCDPQSGFPYDNIKNNIYSDKSETLITDWVHPSETGYRQMGDALAGVIADIRDEA